MTDKEIWEIVPNQFQEKIVDLEVKNEFIQAVQKNINFLSNGEEYFIKYASLQYENFAEFMYCTFRWNLSTQKFKWWFKTVFGYDFIHPLGNEDIDGNYNKYTHAIVVQSIKNYNCNDGFSYSKDYRESVIGQQLAEEDEEYIRTSNIDAYSDGFNDLEDERYYGG